MERDLTFQFAVRHHTMTFGRKKEPGRSKNFKNFYLGRNTGTEGSELLKGTQQSHVSPSVLSVVVLPFESTQ